jgi:hypothetical protein
VHFTFMSERCHDNNHKGWRHPTEQSEHWEIHDADADDDGSSCALEAAESSRSFCQK